MEKFFRYPKLVVGLIGIITLFFAFQIPRIEIDNNNFRFIPEKDEARITSDYIDDTFGSSLFILIGLERKYGTVFDHEFLRRMETYASRIEEIDVVDRVSSIMNADYITGRDDSIVSEKLTGAEFSGSPDEIEELKRRLLSWDMYRHVLVSDDFTATQIVVSLNVSSEEAGSGPVLAGYRKMRAIAHELFDGFAEVYVTGLPVFSGTVNEAIINDLGLLIPLVLLTLLVVLFFSFRNLTALLLPLVTVLTAVVWSIGAMCLFGIKLSLLSMLLPVILLAVGSAYGIHVVTHYMAERGREISREEHRVLVFDLLRKIRRPVFLAAVTTFIGFSSLCFTAVVPIREFGIFTSFGVLVSFAIALTLTPSLLLIRGPKPLRQFSLKKRMTDKDEETAAGLTDIFTGIVRKKRLVIAMTAALVLTGLYGLSKIIVDNVMVEYFKPDTDIVRSDRFIREKFGGSKIISVVLQADDSRTALHPDSLRAMDGLNTWAAEHIGEVGKAMGFTDLIKRINQVFNADESPDGLQPAAASYEYSGDFGFDGFDNSGGFGFGDFSDAGIIEVNISENTAYLENPLLKTFTVGELTGLFDRAGSGGRMMSADDLVWELQKYVNYNGASYYEVPIIPERYGKSTPEELQALVSNYLVLLSGNINDYANDPLEPTEIKTTIQLRTTGQMDTNRAITEIKNYIAANFPENVRVIIGGSALVEASLNDLVVKSQISSVVISLFMVFLIMAVSNRSLAAGIIGIVPLSISILINFAVMGLLGIKLNIGTAMVASLSVGIGIDYTIHFLDACKREYHGGNGYLGRAFATSGRAILINAASVGAGFAVLLLSQFNMIANLGLLIALTMGTSALISLTLLPILLGIIRPKFIYATTRILP